MGNRRGPGRQAEAGQDFSDRSRRMDGTENLHAPATAIAYQNIHQKTRLMSSAQVEFLGRLPPFPLRLPVWAGALFFAGHPAWPTTLQVGEMQSVIRRIARQTEGLGLEKVSLRVETVNPQTGVLQDRILSFSSPAGRGIVFRFSAPTDQLVRPLSEYDQKVIRMRQRGLDYPYEIIRTLTN